MKITWLANNDLFEDELFRSFLLIIDVKINVILIIENQYKTEDFIYENFVSRIA